jgi:prefoldin subunit 5
MTIQEAKNIVKFHGYKIKEGKHEDLQDIVRKIQGLESQIALIKTRGKYPPRILQDKINEYQDQYDELKASIDEDEKYIDD